MGLFDRFRRKSTSSNPGGWLLDALGGPSAASGVKVNTTSAMQVTAVWAAVQAISQDVAKIPPTLKRLNDLSDRDKGSTIVTDHPITQIVKKPNDWQTWFEFAQFREVSKLLNGNAYVYKSYDSRGNLKQLIPILPERVTILEAPDGELFYQVSPGTTFERAQLTNAGLDGVIAPSQFIHHTRNMSLDTIYGLSPVSMFRESIGLSIAAEKHAAKSFGNGARLTGILKHPGTISAEAAARIKKSWDDAYTGVDNAFKTALVEEGMEFQQLSMNNEDAQLLESRQFQVTDIARIFRIPPHKVGDLSRATFSNIEEQSLEYYTDCLMPHFEMVEARMDLDFLTDEERNQGLYFEHDVGRLLRGDLKGRYDAYAVARNWGFLSVNEIRAKEGMNPIEDGDEYMRPLNMVPVGTEADVEDNGGTGTEDVNDADPEQ